MAETFEYFAYGSNMLSHRLIARCDTARVKTVASINGYKIAFTKPSIDESGKATLIHTGDDTDVVIGAVFEISRNQRKLLDSVEGKGYRPHDDFSVKCLRTGAALPARTYIADKRQDDLSPYDWYLALVLAGISEHGLGDEYAALFRAIPHSEDADIDRVSRCDALAALKKAGFADYRALL